MTDAAALPDQVISIVIHAPVQRVWDEITKTGSIQRPLYNTVMEAELRPGGSIRYYSPDKSRVFVAGKVLEVEPPHRLKHTYIFAIKPEGETVVTWNLEEVDGGCRVTLTHAGWTSAHTKPEKHAAGWTEILGLLKSEVETGDIPGKTKFIYKLQGWMMFMLPKTTKREHVDRQGW